MYILRKEEGGWGEIEADSNDSSHNCSIWRRMEPISFSYLLLNTKGVT